MSNCLAWLTKPPPPPSSSKRASKHRHQPIISDYEKTNRRFDHHVRRPPQRSAVEHVDASCICNCTMHACPCNVDTPPRASTEPPWIIIVQEEVAVKRRSGGNKRKQQAYEGWHSGHFEKDLGELRRQQNEKITQRPVKKRVRFLIPAVTT